MIFCANLVNFLLSKHDLNDLDIQSPAAYGPTTGLASGRSRASVRTPAPAVPTRAPA